MYLINKLDYDAIANPYDPLWIDPNGLKFRDGSAREIDRRSTLGLIKGGTWDKRPEAFETHWTFKGLKQKYQFNKEWEETIYVEEGVGRWGYDTAEEFINKRCKYVDELYNSIDQEGYEYNPDKQITYDTDGEKQLSALQKLEPLVVIGRNGTIILRDGNHRLSISKILNIQKIPVHVLCRHKKWQKKRDDIYNNGFSDNYNECLQTHPDLQDVL